MKRLFLFYVCLASAGVFAQAPIQEDRWWRPDGPVRAIEYDTLHNLLLIGGDFTHVAPHISRNAFLSSATGIPDIRFPLVKNSDIMTSVPDGSGGWFIGGTFTKVGDSLRSHIAHVNSSGQVTGKFSDKGFNAQVQNMVMSDDTLYVTGAFSGYGTPVKNVIPFNVSTGSAIAGFPVVDGLVYATAPDGNGGWYLGGSFTRVGDSLRSSIAHINNLFQVTSWNPVVEGTVRTINLAGTKLFIGGYITSVNSQPRDNIAALDKASGSLLAWNPAVTGSVEKIVTHNNMVYLCGYFTAVGGVGRKNVAAIDMITGVTDPWNPSTASISFIYDLLIKGDTIYIGGEFLSMAGNMRHRLASFELINHTITGWNPYCDSTVMCLAFYKDKIIAGGYMAFGGTMVFDIDTVAVVGGFGAYFPSDLVVNGDTLFIANYSTGPAEAIIAVNLLNNTYINWPANTIGWAYRIECANGVLVANGQSLTNALLLESVIGPKHEQVCSIDAATGNLTSWNPPKVNRQVASIAVNDSVVFIGGNFSFAGDSVRSNLAALNKFTGAVTSWEAPHLNYGSGYLWAGALYLKPNLLLVGGDIGYHQGTITKRNFVALDPATGSILPWNPTVNQHVWGFTGNDSIVYMWGIFDTINGIPQNRIAGLNLTNGSLLNFNVPLDPSGYFRHLDLDDTVLYVAGSFDTVLSQPRNNLAAVNPFTSQLLSWNPDPDEYIDYINAEGSKVVVNGQFNSIGRVKRKNFAAFNAISGLPLNMNPEPNDAVTTIACSQNKLYIGGEFDTVGGLPRTSLAAIDLSTGMVSSWDPQLLPPGNLVVTLLTDSVNLYAGGWIGNVGGQTRHGLASFDLSTGVLNPLDFYPVTSVIRDLEKRNDTLYVMGVFGISGSFGTRNCVASIDLATNAITNLNDTTGYTDYVYSGALDHDKIYIGGNFSIVSGQTRNNAAAFDLGTGDLNNWDPNVANSSYIVNTIEVMDTMVLAGGTFVNSHGFPYFAAFGKNSGMPVSWNPYVNNQVHDIKIHKRTMFMGGAFTYYGNYVPYDRKYLAVFSFAKAPVISSVTDMAWCGQDTIGPVPFALSDSINVNTVTILATSSDTNIVKNQNIIISGTGAVRYITLVPQQGITSGCTIYLMATNQAGATASAQFDFINGIPVLTISGNPVICQGSSTNLDAGAGYSSYLWNTGAVTQYINVTAAGTYTVTVSNVQGCIASGTISVSVAPLPVVAITAAGSTQMCAGDSVMLSATPGFPGYQWYRYIYALPGAVNTDYYAYGAGMYRCKVTDANSCSAYSGFISVYINCVPVDPGDDKLQNSNTEPGITVTPNPSQGEFIVTVECNSFPGTEIKIFDQAGRMLNSYIENGDVNRFFIRNLQPGLYLAVIRCGNNFKVARLLQTE